jgi:hypothetical protein
MSILKIRWAIFVIFALWGFWSAKARAAEDLPVNPAVTQANIGLTICQPGFTKTVRPPVAYTNHVKVALLQEMGLPLELIGDFVLDHRISLSAGGSPDARENLVLQDRDESERKDRFEARMHAAICAGEISLRDAQQLLWNWKE